MAYREVNHTRHSVDNVPFMSNPDSPQPDAGEVDSSTDSTEDHSDSVDAEPDVSTTDFADVNIPGASNNAEEDVSSADGVDTDFESVSIDGTTSETSENPGVKDDTVTSEESMNPPEDDSEQIRETHNFDGDSTGADGFSDPDASETWGTQSDGESFEQPFNRPDSPNETADDDREAIVVPESNESESPATDGRDAVADSLFDELKDDPQSGDDDDEADADFSGVSIDGATDATPPGAEDRTPSSATHETSETTESTRTDQNEWNDQENSSIGSAGAAAKTESSNEDVTDYSNGDSATDSETETASSQARGESTPVEDIEAPAVTPGNRIRSPSEIIAGPIHGFVNAVTTTIVLIYVLAVFAIRGATIVLEWVMAFWLLLYGVFIIDTLLFPARTVPMVAGTSTQLGAILTMGIVVVPTALAVFTLSVLVDEYLGDGERHAPTEKPLNRL